MAQQSNGGDLNQQHHQQQQQWMHQQQHQQQWIAMQYPAAAMAMMQQQMMMYPQHYVPYGHHPYQPPHYHLTTQKQHKQLAPEDVKTIWVGDLHHWMDENYLHSCFAQTGEVVSVKVIRNKQTGESEGYGFVEFYSRVTAETVLQNYSGAPMPNTDQPFHLNWATFSTSERKSDAGSDISIFVGDLAADVTDSMLQETFSSRYSSVKAAKVVVDSNTGHSKGYGFVRFGDDNERSRAMTEMNGVFCSSRPMRIGVATPKKSYGNPQQYSSQAVVLAGGHSSNGAVANGSHLEGDTNNTTIFVGGLDSDITDKELRQPFLQYGEVVSVKIPQGKGCGFVQFADRKSAEEAFQGLNGTVIGRQTIRLAWGRTPANKHWRNNSGNKWNGNYGHGSRGYAYSVPQNQNTSVQSASSTVQFSVMPKAELAETLQDASHLIITPPCAGIL